MIDAPVRTDADAIASDPDIKVSARTIRNWASAGYIRRYRNGRDGGRGCRSIFDFDEVLEVQNTPAPARRRIDERGSSRG